MDVDASENDAAVEHAVEDATTESKDKTAEDASKEATESKEATMPEDSKETNVSAEESKETTESKEATKPEETKESNVSRWQRTCGPDQDAAAAVQNKTSGLRPPTPHCGTTKGRGRAVRYWKIGAPVFS